VKFLNSFDLNVLDECLAAFRQNIFFEDKRGPHNFEHILNRNGISSLAVAKEMYHSMQIILEFMDKGMKGLLTGDLSVFAIGKMELAIHAFRPQMQEL
jgi:hypothetical protein